MENKNKIMLFIIVVSLLIITVGGITYAYFTSDVHTKNDENSLSSVTSATITSVTMDLGNKIEANGVLPGYKVVKTIRVTGEGQENSIPAKANILLAPEVTYFKDYVKYSIYEVDTKNAVSASSICSESREVTTSGYYDAMECNTSGLGIPIIEGIFVGTTSVSKEIEAQYNTDKTYYVIIEYMNDEEKNQNEEIGKYFEVTIDCKERYRESILNGTDPVLGEGLIPVTIGDNGIVKKADTSSKWYSYGEKTWANAVILSDETKTYEDNEEIPESEIESYFVWIPRYRYKIFNEGNYEGLSSVENRVQTIEIEFETKNKEMSQGSHVGEWLTHPAFTSFDTNGMWVGKFETGFKNATISNEAKQNVVNTEQIQIKPNVYSWRGIRVANAHLNSYNYKRELDSHMMKNTEWGAVAYLSHSAYGSQASVRINNNSAYITGYAAVSEPTCGYTATNIDCNRYESTARGVDGTYTMNYNNNGSVTASTTGNRSGLYDMSGGAWEYVMGVMQDRNGNLASGRNDKYNSNFIGTLTYPSDGTNKSKTSWTSADGGIPFPEEKYYDSYTYGEDDEHYNRRILGDATGEMGPFANVTYGTQTRQIGSWSQDEGWLILSSAPWFARGAYHGHGLGAGVLSFAHSHGHKGDDVSFRVVLSF